MNAARGPARSRWSTPHPAAVDPGPSSRSTCSSARRRRSRATATIGPDALAAEEDAVLQHLTKLEPFSGLLPRVRPRGTIHPVRVLGSREVSRGVKIGRPPVRTEVDDDVVQASDRPKG